MQHTIAAPTSPSAAQRVEAFKLSGDHGPSAIARFLPPQDDPTYLPTLSELVRADLTRRTAQGETRQLEDYYWDFPELASAQLVADVWRPTDLAVTPAPIRTAHTAIKPMSSGPADVEPVADSRLPQVGNTFAGFRLVEELGQGGFGKVFLAEEPRLAGRRVVLKITLRANNEPQRLARLQHTNIVPIQNAFQAGGLSAVQMPYYGRQTLADLIEFVRADGDPTRVSGQVFSTTMARLSTARQSSADPPSSPGMPAPVPTAVPPETAADDPHPIRDMLARMTYTDAVVWLITRVADGLSHAHARGILHLDLKPANVLFSDDGQPMLLDFNLGYDVGRQDRERIGGTWPYMAPEQIQEYAGEPGQTVDPRTDLYALGVLFFELLTCRQPFPPVARGPAGLAAAVAARRAGPPTVRNLNPTVPPAIEAVIGKLLAPDPARRYQSADELRTDLERHQANEPLKFAPNPSVRELAVKWRRRHPRALANALLAACLLTITGLGAAALNLSETRARDRAARTAAKLNETLVHLRTDLASPTDTDTRHAALKTGADWLARYGVPAGRGWADVPLVRDLPADERAETADALGELAVLMTHAELLDGRFATTPREAAVRAAGWNRAAERWFATTRVPAVVWEQRAAIAAAADDAELAATIPADRPEGGTSRIDLFVRAASHVATGEYGQAIPTLTELTEREKDLFAAHFWLAHCYLKTSQHLRALERYQVARALAPEDYRPAYNRGLILMHLGRNLEAEAEFTDALQRNPRHADSYWHRALARRQLGNAAGAVEDLTQGMEVGVPRLSALLIRADLYQHKLKDPPAAAIDRAAAAALEPQQEREFITRGLTRMRKDPSAALADFERAIALNPFSRTAWQNKGAVLSEHLGRTEEGLAAMARAAELYPEYGPVRMNMAVLLARLGRRDDAHREASRALLSSSDPQLIYQASNVYALTSATHPEDRETALAYLRQALREGFDKYGLIGRDPDMANIRQLPAFEQAVQAAQELTK